MSDTTQSAAPEYVANRKVPMGGGVFIMPGKTMPPDVTGWPTFDAMLSQGWIGLKNDPRHAGRQARLDRAMARTRRTTEKLKAARAAAQEQVQVGDVEDILDTTPSKIQTPQPPAAPDPDESVDPADLTVGQLTEYADKLMRGGKGATLHTLLQQERDGKNRVSAVATLEALLEDVEEKVG